MKALGFFSLECCLCTALLTLSIEGSLVTEFNHTKDPDVQED